MHILGLCNTAKENPMRTIGYQIPQNIDAATALLDIDLPAPVATGHDLLVEVRAISVNPVDVKIRQNRTPEPGQYTILGWDAAGIVRETGPDVSLFRPGDRVFYAGAINRPGTNAEFHLVDERIVGKMPETLDFADAAALPLTAITAWEALFDRLKVDQPVSGAANAILIIGGAGGVGSIAIQLARARTGLVVLATASRPETADWVRDMGAHHVLDHSRPLAQQVESLGLGEPAFVFSTTNTQDHLPEIAKLVAPQGRLALIDDPDIMDINAFKRKAVSVHWEFMFTRSLFQTPDMIEQHHLLNNIAVLADAGRIKSTRSQSLGRINAANLKKAHAMVESGRTIGKLVLEGF
jgi:NADPH:quinone reductase